MPSDPATDDHADSLSAVRQYPRFRVPGRALWLVSAALLLALVAWVVFDPRFTAAAAQVRAAVGGSWGDADAFAGNAGVGRGRAIALAVFLLAAVGCLIGSFLGLFFGGPEHRRMRSWLAFTLLLALWMMLLVSWRELAWQGQRLRIRMSLTEFDAIATSLRDDWPKGDGERSGLGSFMAYPQGNPRMLMVLSSDSHPPISAIERSDDGTLGFELGGDPAGAWLEWHPDGSTPKGFVGGLEEQYDFDRASPLGRGWYLVRYQK